MSLSEKAEKVLRHTLDADHKKNPGHRNHYVLGGDMINSNYIPPEIKELQDAGLLAFSGNKYNGPLFYATEQGMAHVFGGYGSILEERNELKDQLKQLKEWMEYEGFDAEFEFTPLNHTTLTSA